ncbi:MAG: hypothetical protein RBT22_10130 [Aliarcobacter sp.]|nr:hypothetical protein [Aliarcobacter sp.]
MKHILFLTAIVFFFSACAEKKFLINETFINKTGSNIILEESNFKCPSEKNIKLNIVYGDSFIEPMESDIEIGPINANWINIKYTDNKFKTDFKEAIEKNFTNLCNLKYNEKNSYKVLNIKINKISISNEKIDLIDNYFVPVINKFKIDLNSQKKYSYNLSLSGDLFSKDYILEKEFLYNLNQKAEGYPAYQFRGRTIKLVDNATNNVIFSSLGEIQNSLAVSSYSRYDINLLTGKNNYKKSSNRNGSIDYNNINYNDSLIINMFNANPLNFSFQEKVNFGGVISYLTYNIVEEILSTELK